MDYELISLVIGLAIFGGLVWLLGHISFKQGMEVGKRMAVAPQIVKQSGYRMTVPEGTKLPDAKTISNRVDICLECGQPNGHAPDCRAATPVDATEPQRKECPICRVWVYSEGHLNQHLAEHERLGESAKPKPDRRRWMGFSRIKAELESKESA